MVHDILQLAALLANIASFGYYLYQAGKLKGLNIAVTATLNHRDEDSND